MNAILLVLLGIVVLLVMALAIQKQRLEQDNAMLQQSIRIMLDTGQADNSPITGCGTVLATFLLVLLVGVLLLVLLQSGAV